MHGGRTEAAASPQRCSFEGLFFFFLCVKKKPRKEAQKKKNLLESSIHRVLTEIVFLRRALAMSDIDHPLAAPAPGVDDPVDAIELPNGERKKAEPASGNSGSSSKATVDAMADALPPRPPQPPQPRPRPPPLLPRPAPPAVATGRPSSVAVLAATGPWARGEAAIVVTPAARVLRGNGGDGGESSTTSSTMTATTTTLLATIEASTGKILHDPAPGVGTFDSEAEALRALSDIWGGGIGRGGAAGASPGENETSSSSSSSSSSSAAPPPPPPFRVLARGCALLGYLRGGPRSGRGRAVLVATGARVGAQLPGGHLVRAVTGASWVSLPENQIGNGNDDDDDDESDGGAGNGNSSNKNLDDDDDDATDASLSALAEAAAKFKLDGSHYFCETADVTRPFPGRRGIRKRSRSCFSSSENENDNDGNEDEESAPSWEFVWNAAVAAPLRAAGLGEAVPHLLQGVAESRSVALSRETTMPKKKKKGVEKSDGNGGNAASTSTSSTSTTTTAAATLVLLTRSSRLHAGTRYRARGLNALASPGNEVEVEQILWCANDNESESDNDEEERDEEEEESRSDGERKKRSNGASTSSSSSPSSSSSSCSSSSSPSSSIAFSSICWRRGTVPLWWGVEIRGGGVGEAAIVVAGQGGGGGGGQNQNQNQQNQ